MDKPPSLLAQLDRAVGRLMNGLWRALLAVFGAGLMLVLLVLGVAVGLLFMAWALLRGRRPGPVSFRWGRAGQAAAAQRPGAHSPSATGEVVDVEVREISDAAPAPQQPIHPNDRR
jgi:hypothetical protein